MRDGPGWLWRGDLPPGVTAGAVSEKREELASGLRRPLGCVWPETDSELATIAGYSLTTVSHAETGRLWQARKFWESADRALGAGGELLRLYGAWREAAAPAAGEAGE